MQLTILIPMRNEERFVARCLDSILAQLAGREDVEIFCIDGASTDRTAEIVRTYAARDGRVRYFANPARIVPVGLNRAIASARGQVIMRLDCHSEYAPDYVASCLEVLERTGADVVGGYITTRPTEETPVGRAIAAALSSSFGVGGATFRTGGVEREADTVPFGTFRRSVFERFGRFDERLVRNQDIEYCSRIRRQGGRIILSPQIQLTYFMRSTYGGMCRQAFENGQWNPYTLWLTGGGLRLRHFVPLAFVLSVLSLAVASVLWWPIAVLLALVLLLYTAVGAGMALRQARAGGASALLILLAYFQLHWSYGLGSLYGVVTAPLRFGWRPAHPAP